MKLDLSSVNSLLAMSDDGLLRALSLFGSALGLKLTREPDMRRVRAILQNLTDNDLKRICELSSCAEESRGKS